MTHVCAQVLVMYDVCRRAAPLAARENRYLLLVLLFDVTQEEGGGVALTLDLGKGKVFTLSGVPGRGPFSVSTVHPFLLDGLFVENLEEIQAQARRIQVMDAVQAYAFVTKW